MKYLITCLLFFALWPLNKGFAQTLEPEYGAPDLPFSVSNGPQTFRVKIKGSSTACAAGGNLTLALPTGYVFLSGSAQKTSYVSGIAGSTTAATQSGVTSTAATLATGAIPGPNDSLIITYRAYADCSIIGTTGNDEVAYTLSTPSCVITSNTATSNSFNALNAKLNIPVGGVTNSSYTGFVGSVYSRAITITNNGFGTIDTIYLEDKSGKGLALVSYSPTANVMLTKTFTANDTTFRFRIVVPGGLAQNQTFVLTENLKIVSCSFLTSAFDAWYGTNAVKCNGQNGTATAGATVNNSGQPSLVVSTLSYPDLRCVPVTGNVVFKLKNTGAGAMLFGASQLRFGLLVVDGAGPYATNCSNSTEYIDTAQGVQVSRDGGVTWTNAAYNVVIWRSSATNNGTPLTINLSNEVPSIAAGDSVLVRFAIHDESPTCCNAERVFHPAGMKGTYTDACGANPIIAVVGSSAGTLSTTASPSNAPDAVIGTPYLLTFATNVFKLYNVNNTWLDASTGYLDYIVTLPASLAPSLNGSGAPIPADNTISGALPITPGTNWDPTTRTLTLRYSVSSFATSVFSVYQLSIKTMPSGATCGHDTARLNISGKAAACASTTILFTCNVAAPVLVHGCPGSCASGGAYNYGPVASRVSYGAYSPTNNGLPGAAPNTPVLSNLRLNRMLLGDTIAITTKAKILAGAAGSSFTHLFAETTDDAVADQFVSASAWVYNTSGTLTSTITNIPVTVGTKLFTVDAALGTGAPALFNAGDSVIFMLNIKNGRNTDTIVKFLVNIYASNSAAPTQASKFRCDGDYTATMDGVAALITNGTNNSGGGITGCGNDAPTGYALFYLASTKVGNTTNRSGHFPYEIRPLWELDQVRVIIHPNLVLDSLLINIAGQGTIGNFVVKLPIQSQTVSATQRIYYFDASNLHNIAVANGVPFSEGFFFFMYPYWKPGCVTGNFSYGAEAGVSYRTAGSTGPFTFRAYGFNTVSSNGSQAPISVTSPSANKTVATNSVDWEIQITNPTGMSKPNVWMGEQPGVNGVTITSIQTLDAAGGNVTGNITAVNGVYQLGSLAANTVKYYKVTASFTNCVKDSITIAMDYNCDAYPTSVGVALTGCRLQTIKLAVFPLDAALQVSIQSQPPATPLDLCATLDYEIKVLNPALGGVSGLQVQATLPAGVAYINNSYQLDISNGTYVSMSDTNVTMVGGVLTFNVPATSLAYLPGNDSIKVKFQLRTTACAFVSGKYLRFTAVGTSACGATVQGTKQNSNAIRLVGIPSTTNTYSISSSAAPVVACGSGDLSTTYTYKILNQGPSAAGTLDSFDVELPTPWKMNVGSIEFTHNNPSNTAGYSNTSGNTYVFGFGDGLAVGDSLTFNATIFVPAANVANVPCGASDPISESATVNFSTTCMTDGVPGVVCKSNAIVASNDATQIMVSRPNLIVQSILLSSGCGPGSGYSCTVTAILQNLSSTIAIAPNTYSLEFFCGTDVTPIFTGLIPNAIAAGTTVAASIPYLRLPASCAGKTLTAKLRKTMANGAAQCLCSESQALLQTILPVTLIEFGATYHAQNQTATVTWKTDNEARLTRYNVERSTNGITFEVVASIDAKNNNGIQTYSWVDMKVPSLGTWYYRLRTNDVDGKFTYSKMVALKRSFNGQLQLLPNPVTDAANLLITSATEGKYILTIVDIVGRTMSRRTVTLAAGMQTVLLSETAPLVKGSYILKISNGVSQDVLRFEKQ